MQMPLRSSETPVGHAYLDYHVDSKWNFDLARTWLDCCITEHSECQKFEDVPLPTLVIDIGAADSQPRLLQTNGERDKYVALSHC
jgi:hypothetical protein